MAALQLIAGHADVIGRGGPTQVDLCPAGRTGRGAAWRRRWSRVTGEAVSAHREAAYLGIGHGPSSRDIGIDARGPARIGRIRRGDQECFYGPHHAIQLDRRAFYFTAECIPYAPDRRGVVGPDRG